MLGREQNPRPHGNNSSESGGEGALKHNSRLTLVPDFVQTQSAFPKHPIHPAHPGLLGPRGDTLMQGRRLRSL
jgi:hypothetical protein